MSALYESDLRAARLRIAEIAQAILDGRLGIIGGVRQLLPLSVDVDPNLNDAELVGMRGIDSQTDHLPLGEWRAHWAPEALERADDEIAENEAFFRESALRMCRVLAERYSRPG